VIVPRVHCFRRSFRLRRSPAGPALAALLALLSCACSPSVPSLPELHSLPGLTSRVAASPYADGSCQSFAPLRGNVHRTVFIDAGHGGPDPGTSGPDGQGGVIEEKNATLAVAIDLAQILRQQGYAVVLSRTRDSSVMRLHDGDLDGGVLTADAEHRETLARVTCANSSQAGVLLSIHFNGFSDPSVGGAETFYDTARPFASVNTRLATLVQQDVLAAMASAGWQIPDRGTATDTSDDAPTLTAQAAAYPYLLLLGPARTGWLDQPSEMPGVLCEPLFLSDPIEATIAASSAGQQAIARGFAQAIDDAYTPPAATPAGA
jgi:N-acetylmuramoyl-L-alanine amidase